MSMYGDDDFIAFEYLCEIISLLYKLIDSFKLHSNLGSYIKKNDEIPKSVDDDLYLCVQ